MESNTTLLNKTDTLKTHKLPNENIKTFSDDECNPIVKAFQQYSAKLSQKHDKIEEIVKLTRDIRVESKKIIFLLHNVDKSGKKETIFSEAEERLQKLLGNNFKHLATVLENQDCYLYLRFYTSGLEEFIEAYTFFKYLKNNVVEPFSNLEDMFLYSVAFGKENTECKKISYLKPYGYLLSISDLTGELMRKCVHYVTAGYTEDCFRIRNSVRDLYEGFLSLYMVEYSREMRNKIYVLRENLRKIENVCATIVLRKNELFKLLIQTDETQSDEPTNIL